MEPKQSAKGRPARAAWQPLTFRGVAAFAGTTWSRTLLVASLVAVLVMAAGMPLIHHVWFPAVTEAIKALPRRGEINSGRLVWPGTARVTLVENAYLAILVTPNGKRGRGQSADFRFDFGPGDLEVSSLVGYVVIPYPPQGALALNRPELEPLWDAWQPHLRVVVGALEVGLLLAVWAGLATVLAVPLRVYGFLLGRAVSVIGCWRLAVAALLPGALLMAGAIALYSLAGLSLAELLLLTAVHAVVDVIYLLIAPLRLPRRAR